MPSVSFCELCVTSSPPPPRPRPLPRRLTQSKIDSLSLSLSHFARRRKPPDVLFFSLLGATPRDLSSSTASARLGRTVSLGDEAGGGGERGALTRHHLCAHLSAPDFSAASKQKKGEVVFFVLQKVAKSFLVENYPNNKKENPSYNNWAPSKENEISQPPDHQNHATSSSSRQSNNGHYVKKSRYYLYFS